jgi:transposase-like protein
MAKHKKARKRKSSKADRARVAAGQKYEVYYVARKFGVSADTVRQVIKRVGNSRAKIYAALEKM